nr:Lrp/AsnC family transcriptional regulator [Streptomyces sp. DHE17-7]
MGIDRLDGRIIGLLAREPRIGVLEMSRRLGVARGTVQARLDRLQSNGVIRGFGPEVDPAALGYPVTAFATLEIRQGQGADVRAHLATVPEVLELHTTTGTGDMLCRLVARSNADLQRVIDRVVGFDGIVRAATAIVMENPVAPADLSRLAGAGCAQGQRPDATGTGEVDPFPGERAD